MIVTRFAFPVRSPMPLIVPCTCVAPASTATSVFATAQPPSSCVWMPSATRRQRLAHRRDDRRDLGRQRAAVRVAQHDALGARVGGGAHAVERVRRVDVPAVEEVLGVEQRALALAGEEGDRLGDHREVLLAGDAHDLLDVQQARLADERDHRREALGEDPQALVGVGRQPAPAGHAEADDLAALEPLAGEQLEQLLLLGVRRREARLDQVDAEVVEPPHDAQLLLGGQAHAAAAHAVTQGGVVELDGRGHEDAVEPTGTGSSHSR